MNNKGNAKEGNNKMLGGGDWLPVPRCMVTRVSQEPVLVDI